MLGDFGLMVNRLVSWALYTRIHGSWDMRKANYTWFLAAFGDRYAAHYLNAACSVASASIHSWLRLGGDTSHRPYLKRPFARLCQTLFKIERLDITRIRLRLTLAPHQWVYIDVPVHHKRWKDYSQYKLGEIMVLPDGIRLLFQVPDHRVETEQLGGVDFNFNRIVVATNDGTIAEMDISKTMQIQERHRTKRRKIQGNLHWNLKRQHELLAKDGIRERRRVDDLLFEYRREFLCLLENRAAVFEDLSSTTEGCLPGCTGSRRRAKLRSWVHGRFQKITLLDSSFRGKTVYARGTSSFCPFCGSKVEHPIWRVSRCRECGRDYDRDRLSSVSILIRAIVPHKKGEPWALAEDALRSEVVSLLREQCVIKILQSTNEGKTGEASTPPGLWEVPTTSHFPGGGSFIPKAPPNGPDGRATSAPVLERGQGLKTAMMPMTGYGANTTGAVAYPAPAQRFHMAITPEQMFSFRPLPGWTNYRTPIEGLHLCGAGTHPGGGVLGACGYNAAAAVLEDLRPGASSGAPRPGLAPPRWPP